MVFVEKIYYIDLNRHVLLRRLSAISRQKELVFDAELIFNLPVVQSIKRAANEK